MEFQNIVKNLYENIVILANLNCQGCQEFYPSFKNHFCYTTDWNTLVDYFLDIAIQDFPDANTFPKEVLFKSVCDFGTSNDRETQKLY
jgi:hypothetical protein